MSRAYEVEFTSAPGQWTRYATVGKVTTKADCLRLAQWIVDDGEVYAARVRAVDGDVVACSTFGEVSR